MAVFEYLGERFTALDPDDWTIGELRNVERLLGHSFALARGGDRYAALLYVAIRRQWPEFEWAAVDVVPVAVMVAMGQALGEQAAAIAAAAEPAPAAVPEPAPAAEPQRPPVEFTGSFMVGAHVVGPQDPSDAPGAVLSPTNAGSSASEQPPAV